MLKEPILKILNKIYTLTAMIEMKFKRYDLAFKTDENGKIRGERYARRLMENTEGVVLKDHWDHKGRATAQLS
jgi:hypothetical protein